MSKSTMAHQTSPVSAQRVLHVGNPKARYTSMVSAVDALYCAQPRQYTALACLISCYLDAIAARGQRGTKTKFLRFLRANFRQLCSGLDGQEAGRDGASVFYEYYRSEMVHTYFSRNPKYAIAEDDELGGAYVGPVQIGGTIHTAINMDRLYRDFRALAKHRAKGTTP